MPDNDPCEVCGGHECHNVHNEVLRCPGCGAEYDEDSPQFPQVFDAVMHRVRASTTWGCAHMTATQPVTCYAGCTMTPVTGTWCA